MFCFYLYTSIFGCSLHGIFLGVAPTILHLIQCAIVVNTNSNVKKTESSSKPTTSRKEREKSDDSNVESVFDETSCFVIVEQINKQVPREILAMFIKTFMLETNATSVRWQAHALILAIYKYV